MSALELLRILVAALENAQIPFMLTGSFGAAIHGAGRATMDIDMVIEADAQSLKALVTRLTSQGLYVSQEAALDALMLQSTFNVIDAQSGWKADLIIRKSRPFSVSEFARRARIDFEGVQLWVATLEDMVIAKLEWARLGGSERQLEDVTRLMQISGQDVDAAYLDRWIQALELNDQWAAVRRALAR